MNNDESVPEEANSGLTKSYVRKRQIHLYRDKKNEIRNSTEMSDWAYPIIPINVIFIFILSLFGVIISFLSKNPLFGIIILLVNIFIIYLFILVTKGSKIALVVNVGVIVLLGLFIFNNLGGLIYFLILIS
jgi:hypothetical protein